MPRKRIELISQMLQICASTIKLPGLFFLKLKIITKKIWRKIDSNYHILYCKYNRLPIIIFPLFKVKGLPSYNKNV